MPKYPNPTYDNRLLVLIRGDHYGKYVWQICHISDNGPKFIDIAVVIRLQSSVERLSDEQLILGVEDLCGAMEMSKEKTFGNNFMTPPIRHTNDDFALLFISLSSCTSISYLVE